MFFYFGLLWEDFRYISQFSRGTNLTVFTVRITYYSSMYAHRKKNSTYIVQK